MPSILPASKHALLRHLGVAWVAALLAAVWGGASAQTVLVQVYVEPLNYVAIGTQVCDPMPKDPNNKICVDQEPVVTTPGVDPDTNVAISWVLDPTTATNLGWFFDPSDGIYMGSKRWVTIAGPYASPLLPNQYIAVSLKEDGRKKYRYKINLIKANTSTTLKWDPTIMN